MDYHKERFEDCSLLVMDGQRVVAVMPANVRRDDNIVYSHQGLTYGGLLMGNNMDTAHVLEAMEMIVEYYKREYGAKALVYKQIPWIYCRQPSEEDEYALWRYGAKRTACGISTCVNLKERIGYEHSRRNALKKARKNNLKVEESDDVEEYWSILNEVLWKRHSLKPVHTASELRLLKERFPDNIRLYVARNESGRMIAGTYIYIYKNVIHTQYMSASDEARKCGALDLLVDSLIEMFSPTHQWLDFGISTEDDGRWLNEGLIYQKEGFGGRGVVYSIYTLNLI